ncbi:MAG: helix-turn-helix domain-containing protein [Bryobacterales bacterium]|nr:helix-turn-helix domain-containing protein [Bryobacterales bacterium]MBV9397441.1 helix-turn-helix domain-containing protein [Bryobacterales bacterium]
MVAWSLAKSASKTDEIQNNLARLREKRGISAAALAGVAGVSRQTIYAMEAGSYVPNTAVALKLARALEATVEDLFGLPDDLPAPDLRTETVAMLPGSDTLEPGQPVQLCRVEKRTVASAPSPVPWYFPASDAVIAGGRGKTKVRVFHPEDAFKNRLLIAGCDPAISVLARSVQAAGSELVLAHRNSSQSLALLRDGWVHIAGTHLRDEATGESNLAEVDRIFPRQSVAVISYAVWEEGIVTARGNPKGIRGVEDLARAGLRIVNREAGAGSRKLLDTHLKRLGISTAKVRGYGHEVQGHLPAAWQVQTGSADACIATRAAARVFGLGFLPLVSERYDLVIHREHLTLPAVEALLETLGRSSFRRELESLGGYDTRAAGERMR